MILSTLVKVKLHLCLGQRSLSEAHLFATE